MTNSLGNVPVHDMYLVMNLRSCHCKNKLVVLSTEWLPWLQKSQRDSGYVLPYTQVNKRIHLFQKPQEYMHLIPNMRLIMKGKKLTTPPKP